MNHRYCVFLLITIFVTLNDWAMEICKYDNFLHISTPGIEVYSIYRDPHSGIVWLGTNHGLFRYGNALLKQDSQAVFPDLLTNNIQSIQGMKDGTLLLRSITRQYMLYDPNFNTIKDDFEEILSQWGLQNIQSQNTEVIIDKYKNIWIYSGKYLWYYNPEESKHAILKVKAPNNIQNICIGKNKFYILTHTSLYGYDIETSNLLFQSTWLFPKDIRNLKMQEDNLENIWVGNVNLYRYIYQKACWETVYENLFITEINRNDKGDIYVASSSQGIIHYNANDENIEHIIGDPNKPGSLANNRLHSIYIDTDNNLWISYSKQDFAIANDNLRNFHINCIVPQEKYYANDDIISFAYDPKKVLWMGTDGNGLQKMTFVNNKESIAEDFEYKNILKGAITALYVDSSERLWVGLYHGGIMCKQGNKWKTYLEGMSPYSIVENSRGEIYVGLLGDGIYYFPAGYNKMPRKIDTDEQYIMQLFCDRSDTLYIATSQNVQIINTLYIDSVNYRIREKEKTILYQNGNLQSIYKDTRGFLWLISSQREKALRIYDLRTDSVMLIDRLNNQNIKSIIEDNNHNMWGISDNSIINIKVRRNSTGSYHFDTFVYPFRDNNKNVNYYNYRSVAKLPNGIIVFGGIHGYIQIIPEIYDMLRIENRCHKVCIASLQVNNKFIAPGIILNGRQILPKDISITKEINLKHYENNLSFTIHSQDYTNPFKTIYCYRLNKLNSQWLPIINNNIILSNLSPGNYVLEICAYNYDGSMTDILSSLHINVAAPWYFTPIAYIIYAIITLFIIILIVLYFVEKQQQKLRLHLAKEEIERQHQLNEMKLHFFNNIGHDLRTPLTLIITPLEAYIDCHKEGAEIKLLTSIHKNAMRLFNLINQILDFRKLETCGGELKLSNGDIVTFIKDICYSFTQYAENTSVELEFSSTDNSCYMMFDKDKVEKIMMNLLSNAFKYTPNAGKVCVRLKKLDKFFQISVIDNGIGIPDNEKQAIFNRFYQSKAENSVNTGCGIGLHIVNEFVTLHHGTVEVKNNDPTGSIFIVTLPIGITSEISSDLLLKNTSELVHQGIETTTNNPGVSNITILLVEDNEEFLNFLADSLSVSYHILCATNGVIAQNIIETNQIDLIISDVMMDEMDGLKLCHLIKSDIKYSHIPVILLTAKAMNEDEIQGFRMGADDYITKPFNLSILKFRINNLLKNRETSHLKFKTKIEINPSEIAITSLDEQFLSQAIHIVEENIANPDFSVEDLSNKLGIHRAHLYRKLCGITGTPPIEFIRLIRLKRACQYLKKSQMYVSEIAYAVGFNSPKLFSKYFKQEFNMNPKDYIKQMEQEN